MTFVSNIGDFWLSGTLPKKNRRNDLPPTTIPSLENLCFSIIHRRIPFMRLHRIITTDNPVKVRKNGVEATGFRVCGILAFLSCNPEAIIVGNSNYKGGTIIGGRST